MTVENSVSKTPKLVMGAKTYDFNFDVLLEDPTAEEARRAIKCSISNGTDETELIYGTDYTVTLNSDKKGGVVTVTDVKDDRWHIVIYRQYNMTQGVDLNDYNEFPAETIERAFDKQTMLIQELKEIAERSVKVTPANNQTPEELLDEVYSKLDSATEVATNAIAAATLATTAAESATKAVEDAEQQVAEVTKYIDDKKVEIDGIVIDAQNSVDGAINQAVEDVKQAAVNEAESVIQDAGQTATNIAVDYVNTTVKPELQGISDNAEQYATNAKASQEAAKVSETNAKASETTSKQSETNAKVSETNAKRYADSVNPENLLNTQMITNCLTHIPQDIKLELVDGTLTLKAGSKVYVPNGFESDGTTPKFDVVTIESDLIYNFSSGNGTYFLFTSKDYFLLSMCSSGTTDSLAGRSWHIWYDTANNLINLYGDNGNSPLFNVSFPIGIVTVSNNVATSIDQDFNGFGYIGSTVFYLPNVQGKTANGLNADGTYKGTNFTTTNVVTRTFSSGDNKDKYLAIRGSNLSISYNDYTGSNPAYYDKKINQFVRPNTDSPIWNDVCVFGLCTMTKGVISNFRPHSTFQAVDRNDTSWLSGLGMPSDKYVDLTLGASGSSYTAPANGWFYLSKKATGDQYAIMRLKDSGVSTGLDFYSGKTCYLYLPCFKGQEMIVNYSAAGTTNLFRFIYAEGETE